MSLLLIGSMQGAPADGLADGFRHPPDNVRPWVFWFWINGNISREGITQDLEAMKRVGVGGVISDLTVRPQRGRNDEHARFPECW